MDRVELHQSLSRDSALNEFLPAAVTEDPFDKILPERRIAEPSFFFDRNQRKLLDKGPRKQSDSVPAGPPMLIVDTNSLDTATRRTLLKDVPGQIQLLEFPDTIPGHHLQCACVICYTLDRHESGILRIADQSHRLARGAQPSLNLGTDGDPLHIATQHLRQKSVSFMSPVESDFFAEETTADANTERQGRHLVPCCLPRAKYSSWASR